MKELIWVRVQYASRQQCCKTHKRPLLCVCVFMDQAPELSWSTLYLCSNVTHRCCCCICYSCTAGTGINSLFLFRPLILIRSLFSYYIIHHPFRCICYGHMSTHSLSTVCCLSLPLSQCLLIAALKVK